MTEKLLRVKDVAERLNVHLCTAYELIHEGKLPFLRVGSGRGTIRVRPADLDRFISDSMEAQAPSLPGVSESLFG